MGALDEHASKAAGILAPAHVRLRAEILRCGADGLVIVLAYLAACVVALGARPDHLEPVLTHLPSLGIALLVWFGLGADRRMSTPPTNMHVWSALRIITRTYFVIGTGCITYSALLTMKGLESRFTAMFLSLAAAGHLLVWICGYVVTGRIDSGAGGARKRILVVGINARSQAFAESVLREDSIGRSVVEFLDDSNRELAVPGCRRVGELSEFEHTIEHSGFDEVAIFLPLKSTYEKVRRMLEVCQLRAIPTSVSADFYPVTFANASVAYLDDIPLLSLTTISEDYVKLAVKRLIDIAVSAAGLTLLSPLFLCVALVIKLDSPGPVFYLQQRTGKNLRRFRIRKFRTMLVDAEAHQTKLAALNEMDGPVFKIRNDPRVTRVGKFLRKSSIDELPQLINVLLGQMSLVGPRPPIPAEVEKYTWTQRRRLSVRPGITGLWQVSGRNAIAFEEWVRMDLAYIDTWSLWGDFVILLRTVPAVLKGDGAS